MIALRIALPSDLMHMVALLQEGYHWDEPAAWQYVNQLPEENRLILADDDIVVGAMTVSTLSINRAGALIPALCFHKLTLAPHCRGKGMATSLLQYAHFQTQQRGLRACVAYCPHKQLHALFSGVSMTPLAPNCTVEGLFLPPFSKNGACIVGKCFPPETSAFLEDFPAHTL